ncbi:hypothetical protein WN990_39285 [Kitasatospora purpeofusca]
MYATSSSTRWTERKAANSVNPQSLVKAVCSALTEHGPSHWPWKLPTS